MFEHGSYKGQCSIWAVTVHFTLLLNLKGQGEKKKQNLNLEGKSCVETAIIQ